VGSGSNTNLNMMEKTGRDDGTNRNNGTNGKIKEIFRLFRYFCLFRHLFCFFASPQNPLVPANLKSFK
jgi:hypothetical protein